jgi:hypothetical protein
LPFILLLNCFVSKSLGLIDLFSASSDNSVLVSRAEAARNHRLALYVMMDAPFWRAKSAKLSRTGISK